jgi:GT2 family glycosyltransferase
VARDGRAKAAAARQAQPATPQGPAQEAPAAQGADPAEVDRHDVFLGYLTKDSVTQSFHRCFLDLIGYDLSGPCRLQTWASVRSGALTLPEARNQLCEKTLESPAQWLFMLDDDMGFEPDTLSRLLVCADPDSRPVVGGLAFAMRELRPDGMGGMDTFPSPTILMWQGHDDGIWRFTGQEHYPVNALIRVGATGGACLLIHRRALERMRDVFGPTWFDRERDGGGALMGEDVSFFWRLQEVELPAWVHTGIRTTHYKHVWLGESDFWQSRVAPPATERVDVIVPAYRRPQNVATLMRSLRATTGLATAWFVCEPGDLDQHEAVRREGDARLVVAERHAGFTGAVNLGYRASGEQEHPAPWLLVAGDDVRFRPGWLDQAQDVARRYDAHLVATNDLLNPRTMAGDLATHPLIRRSYVDQVGASWDGPGTVCHEGYHHMYCDDEWTMAARLRGVFQPALGSHVEHVHPMGAKAEEDETYRHGNRHFAEDGALYQARLRRALQAPDEDGVRTVLEDMVEV